MKVTVFNPTNEKIGIMAHGRQVVFGPKDVQVISEKMSKACLQADPRLRTDTVDYSEDQIAEVDKLRKPELQHLCKSLMRGIHLTPAEAAAEATPASADIPPSGPPLDGSGADETGTYETKPAA